MRAKIVRGKTDPRQNGVVRAKSVTRQDGVVKATVSERWKVLRRSKTEL